MFSDLYDKKYLFKCLLWFGIVFGLMRATGGAGFAIVIPMVLYCLLARKTEALLFWLLVAICGLIVNPYIVPKGGGFGWMQRGLMLFLGSVMAFNVMAYPMHGAMRPYAGMLFYIAVMILSSMQGWNPKISFLKLLLFSLIYFTYLGIANQVGINPQVSSRKIRSVMLSVAILFIMGSVALVPFPGLSQLKAEAFETGMVDLSTVTSLFMGMTNHSQCLGPIISVTSTVLLGDMLFSIKKVDLVYMVLLICCPYLVYLTSSRTGMGAYILGHIFVFWVFMIVRGIGSKWKSNVITFGMTTLTLLLIAFMSFPSLQDKTLRFLTKGRPEVETKGVSTATIISSRQALIDNALYNFRKSPMIGNGFQVSAEMAKIKDKGLAILSAPIEKGVWIVAILEEGGIVGWVVFVMFLFACITKSIRRRAYIGASCLFVFTITNLGEFTFFSMSYSGGFCWAMIFVGLALDLRKMEDENEALRQQMEFEQMQMEMDNQSVE